MKYSSHFIGNVLSKTLVWLFFVPVLVMAAQTTRAQESESLFIMPPQYNYQGICKAEAKRFQPGEIEKLRQTPLAQLPPDALLRLAEAYSENGDVITPDYPFALAVIEQILKLPYRGENQVFIDDALFLKYDILYEGKAGEGKRKEAKAILDTLLAHNHDKAHRRYGEIYEDEQKYAEAVEAYKKAIIGGNIAAHFNLTRLYYQQKVKTSPKEFKQALSNLHDAALRSIARGNCQPMVEMAKLYAMFEPAAGAKAYSLAWAKQAAATPIVSAKLYYAEQLKLEAKTPEQWKEIVALWEDAARLGSVRAMRNLGDFYLSDISFDPIRAAQWLQQASIRKDAKISTLTRWAKSLKYQSPIPYPQVIAIYKRIAAQGYEAAWYQLGNLHKYAGQLNEAMAYYQKGAEAKHVPSMKALQSAYNCNIGVGFDEKKAEFWREQIEIHSDEAFLNTFFKAAQNDFAAVTPAMLKRLQSLTRVPEYATQAQIGLAAYHYHQGDKELASREIEGILRQDIQEDNDYAGYYKLGELFYNGTVFYPDKDYGLKLLQRAAAAGNPSALLMLGDVEAERKRYPQAIHYYQEAAKEEDSAYRKLYYLYQESDDIPKAVESLKRLAVNDDVEAMLHLAQHYRNDLQDTQNASYWFDQATKHYPCEAETVRGIAVAYMHGEDGAPLDKGKAKYWWNYLYQIPLRSHSNAVALARTRLYQEDMEGFENRAKKQEALQFLTEQADAGNKDAQQSLLNYYLLASDAKNAVALLTRQAKQGSVDAMIYLSNLYLAGFAGVPADEKKSLYWSQQAETANKKIPAPRLSLLTYLFPHR